jgi:hypothetical protein
VKIKAHYHPNRPTSIQHLTQIDPSDIFIETDTYIYICEPPITEEELRQHFATAHGAQLRIEQINPRHWIVSAYPAPGARI